MRSFVIHLAAVLIASVPLAAAAAEPREAAFDRHGDALPTYARQRLGTVRFRHGEGITDLRLLDDGKTLLTIGTAGTGRFWDTATGRQLHRPFRNWVGTALSPDGRILATTEGDPRDVEVGVTIRLEDSASGKTLRRLNQRKIVAQSELVFSADGKRLAAQEMGQGRETRAVVVWDVASGKEIARLAAPQAGEEDPAPFFVSALVFSPDGKVLVATGTPNNVPTPVHRWDVDSGKLLPALERQPATMTWSMTFSPDGGLLAELMLVDLGEETRDLKKGVAKIRLWNPATGKKIRDVGGFDRHLHGPFFSGDSKRFATVEGNATVRVWNAATGKEMSSVTTPDSFVTCAALAPDGQVLAVGAHDRSLRLWDAATGKLLHELKGYRSQVVPNPQPDGAETVDHSLAFSADGKIFAAGGGMVHQWRVAGGQEVRPVGNGHDVAVWATAVSSDGRTVATLGRDHQVCLWDLAGGKEVRRLAAPETRPAGSGMGGTVAFSPDDKLLAVSGPDQSIRLWNLGSGKDVLRLEGKGIAVSLAFLSGGKALVSGDESGRVVAWDLSTGKQLRQFAGPMIGADADIDNIQHSPAVVAVSPNGQMLSAVLSDGAHFQILVWELASGKERRRLSVRTQGSEGLRHMDASLQDLIHPATLGGVSALAFTPDSKAVVWAAGSTVRLWDLATGKEQRRFGTQDLVFAMAIAPDGGLLAAAGEDGSVHLWETATGTALGALTGHRGPAMALAFLPDAKSLVSGGTDTTALVWDVARFVDDRRAAPAELSPDQVGELWQQMAGEDADRAYDALVKLATVPQQTLPWLKTRIKPAQPLDTARLGRLLADLESDQFDQRKAATVALEKLGELAEPRLRKRLAENPPLEVRQRLEQLLEKAAAPLTEPEPLRALRAVELLERIGTPEAQAILQTLAQGEPEARLTRTAAAALKRLGRQK